MLPELLVEIIKRVERCDDTWPVRRDVVACGCVCKRWRDITREVVLPPVKCGLITFPSCLKQVDVIQVKVVSWIFCVDGIDDADFWWK